MMARTGIVFPSPATKINPVKRCHFTVIDFGEADEASGAGIYFWVEDLTGNGYPDIVAPGKDGLYLFENLGPGPKEDAVK